MFRPWGAEMALRQAHPVWVALVVVVAQVVVEVPLVLLARETLVAAPLGQLVILAQGLGVAAVVKTVMVTMVARLIAETRQTMLTVASVAQLFLAPFLELRFPTLVAVAVARTTGEITVEREVAVAETPQLLAVADRDKM
jgi:hypothetical protein